MQRWLVRPALMALGCAGSSVGHATVIESNLNFATANQNLWGPGSAAIVDESITLPPGGLGASIDLGSFQDPASAIASFIGVDVGVSLSPTATFDAALSASFHANSGSIDLTYPERIQLSIPDSVQSGQSFTVSASLPGSAPPIRSLGTFTPTTLAAAAGGGYATPGLSALLNISSNVFTPSAGFSTVFPYAEAKLNLDFSVAGSIASEACLIACFDGPTIDLGSVDLSQQLFELNTLSGLKVLDQSVVSFDQTVPVAEGVTIGFSSPNISLDGQLLGNGTLRDSDAKDFLSVAFNVNQLIPLVGQLLQSNIGPIGYDLLSISPGLSLGIRQEISFAPTPMVALQFDSAVYDSRDGLLKNNIVFAVGDSVILTPTVGSLSSGLTAKPTFFLDNTIHNHTELVLKGTLDVKALELDTPVELGPAFHQLIDLGEIPLLALDDRSWTLSIPAITREAQTIARTGVGLQLQNTPAHVTPVDGGGTNSLGHSKYDIFVGGNLLGEAFGDLVRTGGFGCTGAETPGVNCQQFFVSDDDLFGFNQEALGRYLCIVCNDLSSQFLPTSPSLTDFLSGDKLFLSDLTSYPSLLGLDDLLDPTSPLYDTQMAATQYFQTSVTRAASVIPAPSAVPEPESETLLLSGVLLLGWSRRRANADRRTA